MSNNQLSLLELNQLIKDTLDDAFANLVWVKAEISEMTVNRNGHCYLELVDVDPQSKEVLARTRATVWSYSFRMLKPYFETITGQSFTQGIKILVSAKVEFHPVYGMSLNIRDIDPTYTMGDMARKRREIILQLQNDGVFDMNRELDLPMAAQRIAIVSSPTAAGLQDFIDQLNHNPRQIRFYTKLFPAVMQGAETASSVIQALEQIYQYEDFFDLVVIIRGGGAQLDLASFDHYELAYHVAQFPIPVVTGIGHEKDETVVDLVAHTKMKTPTAVAEFLINGAENFELLLNDLESRFVDLVQERLAEEKNFLEQAVQQLKHGVRELVTEEKHRFKINSLQLKNSVPRFLKQRKDQFRNYSQQLIVEGRNLVQDQQHGLKQKTSLLNIWAQRLLRADRTKMEERTHVLKIRMADEFRLQQNKLQSLEVKQRLVDPVRILQRGYSLSYKNGKIIKSVADLNEGDELQTQLSDGTVKSKIIKTEKHGSKKNEL
ncbi:exodeoxyribonuclease VII large subunit [Mangrovibacterium sp.]|uniref:exodeoxyribonuclease VII large subunit n=1 Tax=Mangrovibacterium sp. TaxID=1961364 RepID=UPI0035665486